MTDCAYCGMSFKNIRAHERKCKPVYEKLTKTIEKPSTNDVLEAKRQVRVGALVKAREARSARAREAQMARARALLDIPEQETVEQPAQEPAPAPAPEPEPTPASPSPPGTPDWYSTY